MDGNENFDNNGSWQFQSGVVQAEPVAVTPQSVATPPTGPEGAINWTASEFVAHQKSGSWYALLAAGTIALTVLVLVITRDIITAVVILLGAGAFAAVAARKPRVLAYRLDQHGLTIADRHHRYGEFRSFSVLTEGAVKSIVLMPLKRFAMLTTVHYDPRDEEKIFDLLTDHLPYEERKRDPIDSLMWRIRF
jgi:hypothetical protein